MKFSKLFAPTLKETPKDAVLKSHEYLLRGGFVQQMGSGIYNFLPLGQKVLAKIRKVVEEEMDAAGAQQVMLGFVTPEELWKKSGRLEKYGKELLRFCDRKENRFVLGPTHEEMAVSVAKDYVQSYKQLPLHLYQIHLKFRDEMRPRFGLLRTREFIMKDGYSFHSNQEDLTREFDVMEATYKKIFARLGLAYRVVEADSGAIGGTGSKEFVVMADSGEDTIVLCKNCTYAANIEAARRKPKKVTRNAPTAVVNRVNTPEMRTAEEVANFLKTDPFHILKAVVRKARFDQGKEEWVVFFLRGSDSLEEAKALKVAGANELVEASDNQIWRLGLELGFIGPKGAFATIRHEMIFFDSGLKEARGLVCGADEVNYHLLGFNMDDLEHPANFVDLTAVKAGDLCVACGGELVCQKGIEVGHIFQLGTRYSEPMGATFLDTEGQSRPLLMGCYGIGVSRLLAAVIEQSHDAQGCIWTPATAPFSLMIVVSNTKDSEQSLFAETLYGQLNQRGIEVLLDDRDERFGVKMADFELIGIPYAVVVGKGLEATGTLEWVERKTLKKEILEAKRAFDLISSRLCTLG